MSKAAELAMKVLEKQDTGTGNVWVLGDTQLEAFYAAAQKEVIDRLTAGVEMPRPYWQSNGFGFYSLAQMREYGAAQRLAGAREEREECAKVVDIKAKYYRPMSWRGTPSFNEDAAALVIFLDNIAAAIRTRGEA